MTKLVTAVLLISGAMISWASAQVINGEGTYEGSSLHDPPPAEPDSAVHDRSVPERPSNVASPVVSSPPAR